jgi:UDP-galactopyranose mutase
MKKIAIAGAGFAGAVLARELASAGYEVHVFEERDHLGGNAHTKRDEKTGIMLHAYGPHIFNTSRKDVWDYVRRFGEFGNYINRVKAVTSRGVFSLPINLLTINQFFGKKFSPREAAAFIAVLGDSSIQEPQSFEEQALKFVGRDLYEAFFLGYTKKQWGMSPKELPASILQRLPVRFNYDDNYYASRYQGIPVEGYTKLIENILDVPNVQVHLKQRFSVSDKDAFEHLFYSGPLDGYFGYRLGKLNYRTLVFERFDEEGDYQGNPVINYCEERVPYTRISEHKHFAPWETHAQTVSFREYSKLAEEGDTLYYPIRLVKDKEVLASYMELAENEHGVTFIGRLGTYRYLDMHVVIGESLDLAKTCLSLGGKTDLWPAFSGVPLVKNTTVSKAA